VALRLNTEDADDRDKWRRRAHVADPSPVREQYSLKERENAIGLI